MERQEFEEMLEEEAAANNFRADAQADIRDNYWDYREKGCSASHALSLARSQRRRDILWWLSEDSTNRRGADIHTITLLGYTIRFTVDIDDYFDRDDYGEMVGYKDVAMLHPRAVIPFHREHNPVPVGNHRDWYWHNDIVYYQCRNLGEPKEYKRYYGKRWMEKYQADLHRSFDTWCKVANGDINTVVCNIEILSPEGEVLAEDMCGGIEVESSKDAFEFLEDSLLSLLNAADFKVCHRAA